MRTCRTFLIGPTGKVSHVEGSTPSGPIKVDQIGKDSASWGGENF